MARNPDDYDEYKKRQAKISRERSAEGRDIGELPLVADPSRKSRCANDLELFGLTYFPNRFGLSVSDSHRTVIQRMQACVLNGGRAAVAMPRGSGKSTWAEVAVIFALVYGYRRFVVLLGATERHATKALRRIQSEFEANDLLAGDFPEVCFPIRALERIHNRAKGQTLGGEPTRIELTAESMTLPRVKGSVCSGSSVAVSGLTGAVRGLNVLGADGQPMRPDMVILDDCQTRESAKSPSQTADRLAIIRDDVLGLAGPTTQIAAFVLCTVIYPDDLSDRLLDRDTHPEWQGIRTKMIEQWPKRMDKWDEYGEIWRDGLRNGDEGAAGNAYYLAHRQELDEGCVVSWPDRYKQGEVSAIQSAMNLFIENPRGFRAEYQNDPEKADIGEVSKEYSPSELSRRVTGLPRYMVPRECHTLTAGIDVGADLLWWVVMGWTDQFGGSVLDYGCWPRQNRSFFQASDARPGLRATMPGLTTGQVIYRGLNDLSNLIFGRTYEQEGGGELPIAKCLVDSGYETDSVYQFVRSSERKGIIYPSKGIGRTITTRGVAEWKSRPGERIGWHWRMTRSDGGRGQMVQFDPDFWKTFVHDRFHTALGTRTALTLFGDRSANHEMFADHLSAEYGKPEILRGLAFDKWTKLPGRTDNHFLDCVVLASIAASVAGVKYSALEAVEPAKGKKTAKTAAEVRSSARRIVPNKAPVNRR